VPLCCALRCKLGHKVWDTHNKMILLKESLLENKLWPLIKAKIPVLTIERALSVCLLHVRDCVCILFMTRKVTLHVTYRTYRTLLEF
jgi:hypothetical protein